MNYSSCDTEGKTTRTELFCVSFEQRFIRLQTLVICWLIIVQAISTVSVGMWVNSKLSQTPADVLQALEGQSGRYPRRLQRIVDEVQVNRELILSIHKEHEK